jgi:hypothetical protein
VVPFSNLSGDPSQDYFADGITEDLTSDLSRIAGSFVISRNTAFTFKGKAVDARQIGGEWGVRYVLEGSVRRMGGTVRVNAQLIAPVERAIRLSRRDPELYVWYFVLCHANKHLARDAQAIEWCLKSLATRKTYYFAYVDLASAYAWRGRTQRRRPRSRSS